MHEAFERTLNHIVSDKELHLAYLYILSKMDQASLTLFSETWPTIAVDRRRSILANLVEISEINFEVDFDPVFLIALGDDDAEVRASAINGLWENENPDLIEPFLHLLHTDDTALVRATAASALGRFLYMSEIEELDPARVEPIKGALLGTIYQAGEDIDVRRRAVEAIAFLSEPGINEIIESAYYDEDEKMRVSAVFAMGRNADRSWRPCVLAELDSDSSEIRFEAARACGELEVSEAIPRLIMLIDEVNDTEVQEMCIWALGRIGGQTAREALEACAESDNEALALAAEESLEELSLFTDDLDMFDFGTDLDDIDLDNLENALDDADDLNPYLP